MRAPHGVLLPILFVLLAGRGQSAPAVTDFPTPFNSEPEKSGSPPPAAEAASQFKLPPGFEISVFAAEPDVQNPIAMTWDARGRLWVAENYTYAERGRKFERSLRDRVLIFEDKDGDGHHDSRKVFTDDVQMLTSVEVGLGAVWLLCPPQLLVIFDRNGDDVPDFAPHVVLDGFAIPSENYHNFANGLRWGPDGWLYGRCGASSPGEIGAPGTPPAERVPLRGGMWRYHPARKVFEALTHGTTNPWGHDWDEHGELFFINTVNGHLWHAVAGMHFVRPHTIDPNPHVYSLIDHHADHWHFDTGRGWAESRDGKADAFGGGHAHIGMMIYQGDNWPASYQGRLFTLNMHGRRANVERLDRQGSGYIGRHEADILQAGDPWFRGMEISSGPDGGVYLLDWSDAGECHDSTGVHRTSGRIYKVTQGKPKVKSSYFNRPAAVQREDVLLRQLNDPDAWFARKAQQEFQAWNYRGGDLREIGRLLRHEFDDAPSTSLKLRYLWTLNAIDAADTSFLREQLRHSDEHIRAWAIRLLTDSWPLDGVMGPLPASAGGRTAAKPDRNIVTALTELAVRDSSALVRLILASTLQRLPAMERPPLAKALVAHGEDANDHNLPLMIWYGLAPVADVNPGALAEVGLECLIPQTLKCIARRLSENNEKEGGPLNTLLAAAVMKPDTFQSAVVAGMTEGFTGWRKATRPPDWPQLVARIDAGTNVAVREQTRSLSVLFGDGRALEEVKRLALDGKEDIEVRRTALQSLIESKAPEARQVCEQLLNVRFLNTTAARGLSSFDDPGLGEKLAKSFRNFHPSERSDLMATLVSRPVFAAAMLKEMAAGRIGREELSAFHARQIRSFKQEALGRQLALVWGEIRDSEPEKRAKIAKLKAELSPEVLRSADQGQGRLLFNTACAACHRLHGHGADAGPDLTGSGRDNLDYLLENIVDPSGVVSADFKMTVANLKDGRVLNGIVSSQNERTLTLKTMNGVVTVEKSDVLDVQNSNLSLMPEGLLDPLSSTQVRDLFAYLMNPAQVPLPAAAGAK
jgi:putative membrane-bound dehydrogenase-like protein